MSILYVTSFSRNLYHKSGHKLLSSWIKHQMTDDLLICYDQFDFERPNILGKLHTYVIDDDNFWLKWKNSNLDIIPKELGGKANKRSNPNVYSSMNARASQFFKKIVSLHHALEKYGDQYDVIVWIDCDCILKKYIPKEMIMITFDDHGVFYHLGPKRKKKTGVETGFTGYQRQYDGYELLKKVFECYESGKFRGYVRWDDSWVMKEVIHDNPMIKCLDLIGEGHRNHVIKYYSPFKDYLEHNKGNHHLDFENK